jgi:predicted flap endonuclease-1-like 5' DNA nuclease
MSKARKEAAMMVLTGLVGVGPSSATKMVAAGMENAADVAAAGAAGLVKAGLTSGVAGKIYSTAEAALAAAKAAKASLTALAGIGPASADKLLEAGIASPAGLIAAGADGLAEIGLGSSVIKKSLAAAAKAKPKKAGKAKAKPKAKPKKPSKAAKKAPPVAKRPATAERHEPRSVVSDEKAGVRGDQVGKKLVSPKGVADMLKRIKENK